MLDRDTAAVQTLRSSCRMTLEAFIDEANKTCSFFDGVEYVSESSLNQFVQMLEQRRKENVALERYQNARLALFRLQSKSDSRECAMRGVVKRFDVERGVGIIMVSGSGERLPVISDDILSVGPLVENDRVSFGVRQSQGQFAANVSIRYSLQMSPRMRWSV